MDQETLSKVRKKALALLASRDYAKADLLQKLKQHGFAIPDIDCVLHHLIDLGLYNENRFIENFIHYQRQKGYGPLRIIEGLKAKGIEREIIAKVLQISDNSWFDDARKLHQKKFKGIGPKDFQERSRQMRFLMYRGFTREQIEAAIEKDSADIE